jgi:hypothetical protein
MADKGIDELLHDHNNDGINRRGFLKCIAWAGTGALCVMQGGSGCCGHAESSGGQN